MTVVVYTDGACSGNPGPGVIVRFQKKRLLAGEDPEFGRGGNAYDRMFGDPAVTPNPCLGAIETAPYYAVPINLGDLGTKGGLKADARARVLDAEASTATLGKTAGKDAADNKPTYVSLLGVARARERAIELRAEAHAALADLGAPATRLRQLADFVIERTY